MPCHAPLHSLPCCAHSKSLLRVSHFFKCRRQWPSYPEKNKNKKKTCRCQWKNLLQNAFSFETFAQTLLPGKVHLKKQCKHKQLQHMLPYIWTHISQPPFPSPFTATFPMRQVLLLLNKYTLLARRLFGGFHRSR